MINQILTQGGYVLIHGFSSCLVCPVSWQTIHQKGPHCNQHIKCLGHLKKVSDIYQIFPIAHLRPDSQACWIEPTPQGQQLIVMYTLLLLLLDIRGLRLPPFLVRLPISRIGVNMVGKGLWSFLGEFKALPSQYLLLFWLNQKWIQITAQMWELCGILFVVILYVG